MIEPILHIRVVGSRNGLAAALLAIVVIFASAIATETSLIAAGFFASLVVMIAAECFEQLEQHGSIDEARRRLDQLEKEERR